MQSDKKIPWQWNLSMIFSHSFLSLPYGCLCNIIIKSKDDFMQHFIETTFFIWSKNLRTESQISPVENSLSLSHTVPATPVIIWLAPLQQHAQSNFVSLCVAGWRKFCSTLFSDQYLVQEDNPFPPFSPAASSPWKYQSPGGPPPAGNQSLVNLETNQIQKRAFCIPTLL